MSESGLGARSISSSKMLPQTHKIDVPSVSGAWLEVGIFFWGHYRGMGALLVYHCPDSVKTLGVSSSEDPV